MSKTWTVVILGIGGQAKKLAGRVQKLGHKVIAFYHPEQEKAEAFDPSQWNATENIEDTYPPSFENGEVPCLSNLDEVWALKPDLVLIASPTWMHVGQVNAASEAGVPAVGVEKPFGLDPVEVSEMIMGCESRGTLLFPLAPLGHWDPFKYVIAEILSGEHGAIIEADFWRRGGFPWKNIVDPRGGGCGADFDFHNMDVALSLIDTPPTEISSVASSRQNGGAQIIDSIYNVLSFGEAGKLVSTDTKIVTRASWRLPKPGFAAGFEVLTQETEFVCGRDGFKMRATDSEEWSTPEDLSAECGYFGMVADIFDSMAAERNSEVNPPKRALDVCVLNHFATLSAKSGQAMTINW